MSKIRMVLYGILGSLLTVGIWSFIGGCQSSSASRPPAAAEAGINESEPITRSKESLTVGESAPEIIPTPAFPVSDSEAKIVESEVVPPAKSLSTSFRSYTVKKGDTLWGISRTYEVPLQEMVEANNLDKPGSLKIGQKLIIPGKPAE